MDHKKFNSIFIPQHQPLHSAVLRPMKLAPSTPPLPPDPTFAWHIPAGQIIFEARIGRRFGGRSESLIGKRVLLDFFVGFGVCHIDKRLVVGMDGNGTMQATLGLKTRC